MYQFPTNRPPSPDGLSASTQSAPYPSSYPGSFPPPPLLPPPREGSPPSITIQFVPPKHNVPLPRSSQHHAEPPEPSRPNTSERRPPRKLDNAKCQRCRRDKVKCSPQPREWPQKCDRCVGKGLQCSPSVVKQRVRKQSRLIPLPEAETISLGPNHEAIPESILAARPTQPEITATSIDAANFAWRDEDVVNIFVFIELLDEEEDFHRSQVEETLTLLNIFPHEERFESLQTRPPTFDQYFSGLHTSSELKQALFKLFTKRLCRLEMDSLEADLIVGALRTLQKGASFLVQDSGKGISDVIKEYADGVTQEKIDSVAGLRAFANKYATKLQRLTTGCGLSLCSNRASTSGPSVKRLVLAMMLGCFFQKLSPKFVVCQTNVRAFYLVSWVRDVTVRYDNKPISIPRKYCCPLRRSWVLSDLSFLTDVVGFNEADNHGHTLLHLAILKEDPLMAKNLLNLGADPSPMATRTEHTLFHYAAACNDIESYRWLKVRRNTTSPEEVRDAEGLLPLHHAVLNGYLGMVKAILAHHSENPGYVNEEQSNTTKTALWFAINRTVEDDYDDVVLVKYLAEHPGIDFLVNCSNNETALHVLASRWDELGENGPELFRLILTAAPRRTINLQDRKGQTALHHFAKHCDGGDLPEILSTPAIQPDVQDHTGRTPLINAVLALNLDAVKALGSHPDVDCRALLGPIEIEGKMQTVFEHLLAITDKLGSRRTRRDEIANWIKTNLGFWHPALSRM